MRSIYMRIKPNLQIVYYKNTLFHNYRYSASSHVVKNIEILLLMRK